MDPERTAERFPEFRRRFCAGGFHSWLTLAEAESVGPRVHASGHWALNPSQLCAALGVDRVATGPPCALVFPRVTGRPGGIEPARPTPEDAFAQLTDGLFRARWTAQHAETLFATGDRTVMEADCRAAMRWRIVRSVSSFTCALGREAYADPRSGTHLVRVVAGAV